MTATEIECPICDRIVLSDMKRCPNCGAGLNLSSFEDLEEVAMNFSTRDVQKPPEAKTEMKASSPASAPGVEEKRPEPLKQGKDEKPQPMAELMKEEKAPIAPAKEESKYGLGRLFGKKKK